MLDQTWRQSAKCLYANPSIFFPSPGPYARNDFTPALAVCSGCPVWAECLDFAFTDPDTDEWGVWGGHTPGQRKQFRELLELAPPTMQTVLL